MLCLLVVNEREEGVVALHLPIASLKKTKKTTTTKNRSGLDPVLRYESISR